jgi:hypothetical protein
VAKADCEEFCRWWRFLQGLETANQDRVMHLIIKKFDTLRSYIAENIKKIEQ